MINIAWGIIVKDDSEYDNLRRALASVAPYVDDIYVTTTGKEVEKIKQLPWVHHSHFDWIKDFAAARNHNMKMVERSGKKYDYYGWCDCDDILVGGEELRTIAERAKRDNLDHVFFEYWYGCKFKGTPSVENILSIDVNHMRERLLKPGAFYWKGRLHETPVLKKNYQPKYAALAYGEQYNIAMLHTATLETSVEHLARNKEILELQLQDEKEVGKPDPRTLLYLMKIYVDLDEPLYWTKTITMGSEYLSLSGWDQERSMAYELMGRAYNRLGQDKKVIELLFNAAKEFPKRPMIYLLLADAYFNLKQYSKAKHWLDMTSAIDLEKVHSGIHDIGLMKAIAAELTLKYYWKVEKNIDKAYEAAKIVYKEQPNEANKALLLTVETKKMLNDACLGIESLYKFLRETGQEGVMLPVLDSLPSEIREQPFAINIRKRVMSPHKWGDDEVCIFASFNQPHFEKWDGDSLKTGIGGSETAVIELARKWAKAGYKVTVYGDPREEKEIDGVLYLSWQKFNVKDSFNIFVQWRNSGLSTIVKAKLFLADFHDLFAPENISQEQIDAVDYFMVKSKFHRDLAPNIPDHKFKIISNGI